MFSLAFAIIEGEDINNWGWLLACIRNRVTQRTGICVISDRHPGIMAAMNDSHCKTREIFNLWEKGKIEILVKTRKFSRSRMTKQILSLESSHEI